MRGAERRVVVQGVAASLAVHAGLLAAWMLQQPEVRAPPAPVVDVVLLSPSRPLEATVSPAVNAAAESEAAAAQTIRPRDAAAAGASPLEAAPPAPAPAKAPLGGPAGAAESSLSALGGAMAARFGCREPETLAPEQRAACADRLAATEPTAVKAEPYFRMREHAAIMAKVRRAENGGYRASCEAGRNFDMGCPNLLPDNHAKDFELPKD